MKRLALLVKHLWLTKRWANLQKVMKLEKLAHLMKRSPGQARPIDGRLITEVTACREELEVVPSSCYLSDCLSSGRCCELATITRCRVAWGKFNELLPILTSHSFPITSRGRVHNSCVKSATLHTSETWAPTLSSLHRLQRNDRAMIRWMCRVTTNDHVSSQDLLERMQVDEGTPQRYSAPADSDGT